MSRPVYIYGLCEPEQAWNVRYVGKTAMSLEKRLKVHLQENHLRSNTHKTHWLKKLKAMRQTPIIVLLDVTDEDDWIELEKFYIASHRRAGFDLINSTDGGEGAFGLKYTEERRKKQSISAKRRGMHPNSTHKGYKHSLESRKKMSESSKGQIPWNKGLRKAKPFVENSSDRQPNI